MAFYGPVTVHATGDGSKGMEINYSTSASDQGEREAEHENARQINESPHASLQSKSKIAKIDYTDFADPSQILAFTDEVIPAEASADAPVYSLKKYRKMGKAVIINVLFENEKEERKGSKIDVEKMKKLWKVFKFEVDVVDAKIATSRASIKTILRQLAETYGGFGAIVVIIMSHGTEINGKDAFKTSDGRYIAFDEVVALFDNKNAQSLRGIPKIFISQFCRGRMRDHGEEEEEDDIAQEFSLLDLRGGAQDEEQQEDEVLPLRSDMLIAHASMAGYKALRNPSHGSFFFNAIANVFMKHARKEHLLELMTRVNEAMAQKTYECDGQRRKQMSEIKFDLRKRLYLTGQ